MKTILYFFLPLTIIMLQCTDLFAQQVVSTLGQTQKRDAGSISFTVGEPVTGTLAAGNGIITQGFHQTRLFVTAIEDLDNDHQALKLWPNPANEILNISFHGDIPKRAEAVIYDIGGTVLGRYEIDREHTEINITELSAGLYLIEIILGGKNHCTNMIVILK